MANRFYEIKCVDEELGIFTVRKKSTGDVYHITKMDNGTWIHTCKALEVYGPEFMCRHKKMILQEFYVNDEFKHRFNITPVRNKTNNVSGEN